MSDMRGRHLALPLVLICLLGGACARLQNVVGLPTTPPSPNPTTAIAVSVLADSVYIFDPSNGAQKTLAMGLQDFQSGFATWAPDHVHLAYGDAGILVLNASGGKASSLNRGQSLSMPAWSPDGKRIAYGDGLNLWVTSATTSAPVKLTLPNTLSPQSMDWTPGRDIVFQGLRLDCNIPGPCLSTDESDIWAIGSDGSGLRQITHLAHAQSPKWSPDGSRILFIRTLLLKKQRVREIWSVRPDGAGLRRLTGATGVLTADWSPDGQQVAMVQAGKVTGTLEIWIAATNGTNLHLVGNPFPGADASIDW